MADRDNPMLHESIGMPGPRDCEQASSLLCHFRLMDYLAIVVTVLIVMLTAQIAMVTFVVRLTAKARARSLRMSEVDSLPKKKRALRPRLRALLEALATASTGKHLATKLIAILGGIVAWSLQIMFAQALFDLWKPLGPAWVVAAFMVVPSLAVTVVSANSLYNWTMKRSEEDLLEYVDRSAAAGCKSPLRLVDDDRRLHRKAIAFQAWPKRSHECLRRCP
jgi:hypothetical protein